MNRIILVFKLCFTLCLLPAFAQNELEVGMANLDITPAAADKIPLGGYGSFDRRFFPFKVYNTRPFLRSFRPAKGAIDPIRAKAMYLKRADKKLLFIGLDVVGVTKGMHQDLIARLEHEGFSSSEVIISATHTHSGPGGLSNNFIWQVIAMDRFQRSYYDRFLTQIVDTVKAAIADARAAELHTLAFNTEGLQHNRRGGALNPRANLLLAQAKSGEWIGGLVNFAVHGTALGASNLFFSADVPGAIEREMEQMVDEINGYVRSLTEAQFIFINGAEGDVTPKMNYLELGTAFAHQAQEHWQAAQPIGSDWVVKQQEVYMGTPKIDLAKCVNKRWMPKSVRLNLRRYISSSTLISQVHFGNLWLLTWPGEPTTETGLQLEAAAKHAGAQEAWVLGLSNDHLAYFTTEDEFHHGTYESCSSFFGATGSKKLIDAHVDLANQLLKK
jgi:hypothetical protein